MRIVRYHPVAPLPALRGIGAGPTERLVEVIDEAKAWAIIQELQVGYMAAEQIVLRLTPQTLTEAFFASPVGLLIYAALHAGNTAQAEQLLSTQKQAALAAVRMNHDRIVSLRTTLFDAAKAGQFPDGRAYSWTQWKSFATDVANDLRAQVQFQADSNFMANALKLIRDMTITVVKILNKAAEIPTMPPSAVPWWVWAAGGLAGLGVLAYTTNTFRALLPTPKRA